MYQASVSSEDLAATIAANPRPILFLDTAAILDVCRVPYRPELQADIVGSVAALNEDVAAEPRRVWVLTSANVLKEFQTNRDLVQRELEAFITNLDQSLLRISDVARIVLPERQIQPIEWLDTTFQNRILGIMDRLVSQMAVFSGHPDCIVKARNRLWSGLAPASKSKQEFKDCEIFEDFLEFVRNLRAKGVAQPVVFVTPNSRDYGPPPKGNEQIASDLKASEVLYASNIAWAQALVRQWQAKDVSG